ncbi:hypothetical protein HDV63DRAFT_317410 [Trichoderma sp. SZMC 28014]
MMHSRLRATVMASWPSFCWLGWPSKFRKPAAHLVATSPCMYWLSDRVQCMMVLLVRLGFDVTQRSVEPPRFDFFSRICNGPLPYQSPRVSLGPGPSASWSSCRTQIDKVGMHCILGRIWKAM